MTSSDPSRPLAVLDTSFWTAAYRAEVAANCLDLFDIVVPDAVEREILSSHRTAPQREYPYATLFRHLRGEMRRPPTDAPPLSQFGLGEAAAISLALHLRARLLINERPAARYASSIGVRTITVPGLIVVLRLQGTISHRAAHRKLGLTASITSDEIIAEARLTLDQFADLR